MNSCKIDNIKSLNSFCYQCSSLEKVDLKGIDTSKITNMGSMFNYCGNLTSLDLSDFDTSNVTNTQMMFYNCKKLKYLDIRSFVFDKVTAFHGSMFGNIPADCLIIVKGDTEKEWVLARRSDLTNIKTVAEIEGV
jgi:surface protein